MNAFPSERNGEKRRGAARPAALLVLVLVLSLAFAVTACAPGEEEADSSTSISQGATSTMPSPSTQPTVAASSTTTIYRNPIDDPARLTIPAIEVDAEVVRVGRQNNGDMELPPFGVAAWYTLGPSPGDYGPSVIVGHVDSKKGPDVFYRLKDLAPGDEFTVYGEGGGEAVFVVDSKEQQLKSELPTERIWNDTWQPVIRLITCGGDFDRSTGHYLSNVIVYGHLVR